MTLTNTDHNTNHSLNGPKADEDAALDHKNDRLKNDSIHNHDGNGSRPRPQVSPDDFVGDYVEPSADPIELYGESSEADQSIALEGWVAQSDELDQDADEPSLDIFSEEVSAEEVSAEEVSAEEVFAEEVSAEEASEAESSQFYALSDLGSLEDELEQGDLAFADEMLLSALPELSDSLAESDLSPALTDPALMDHAQISPLPSSSQSAAEVSLSIYPEASTDEVALPTIESLSLVGDLNAEPVAGNDGWFSLSQALPQAAQNEAQNEAWIASLADPSGASAHFDPDSIVEVASVRTAAEDWVSQRANVPSESESPADIPYATEVSEYSSHEGLSALGARSGGHSEVQSADQADDRPTARLNDSQNDRMIARMTAQMIARMQRTIILPWAMAIAAV